MKKLVVCAFVLMSSMANADGPHDRDTHKFSVTMHDGSVEIDGIGDYIDAQLDAALNSLRSANLPPEAREKLTRRLDELRDKLRKRLGSFDLRDMDELGREMDEFGREMSKWGEEFGKEFGKDFAKQLAPHLPHLPRVAAPPHVVDVDDDADDDDDLGMSDDDGGGDIDDDDVRGLGDLSLNQPQRDALAKLRADSERQVAAAKKQLAAASKQLRDEMRDPDASDAELARAIDAVAQQEAMIRKARILAWHGARRVLDDSQRKKIERAARVKSH
ncbi:MAG TPA: hypothetical protein VMJ10_02070 [Kofleriaceae bacterium]|nr:hypothetical protein [Kofleriaceae bacterium]